MGKPHAYRYVKWRSLGSAFFDHLPERPLQLFKRCVERGFAGINHNVPLRADFGPMQTEEFTNPAFDAVTDDSPANGPRYGKSEARRRSGGRISNDDAIAVTLAGQAKRRKQRTGKATAIVIDGLELDGAQDPRCLRTQKRAVFGRIRPRARTGQLFRR